GKSCGRKVLDRAPQKREIRAPRRVWPARATLEIRRHARASERMLEQRRILLRRAHGNRHAIERDAAARLAKHTARDLDAFAPLARRGKEIDLLERFPRRRRGGGKH